MKIHDPNLNIEFEFMKSKDAETYFVMSDSLKLDRLMNREHLLKSVFEL